MQQTKIHRRQIRGRTYYYCYLDGSQRGLGYDSLRAAKENLRLLMGGKAPEDAATLAEIVVLFDAWGRQFSAPRTAEDYSYWLKRLVGHLGLDIKAIDVQPHHIDDFVVALGIVGTWGHVKVVRAVRRLYRWARNQGRLHYERSPITGLASPTKPASPETLLDNRQLIYLLRTGQMVSKSRRVFVRSAAFGAVVRFMLRTGARPEEARMVRAEWVDLEQRTITIPWRHAKQGKATRRDRVIRYPARLARMIERRVRRGGLLFRSSRGSGWTRASLDAAFDRAKARQPALFPDGCYARALRYTYTTRAIVAGVGIVELAHLLGHTNTSMIMRHYQKLGRLTDHLRDAADLAAGRGP